MKNVLLTIVAIFIFSLTAPFAEAETVIIHEVINQKKENYNIELEKISDLATIVNNMKNSWSSLGNKCTIEDLYFDGDITHVNISCKKIRQ